MKELAPTPKPCPCPVGWGCAGAFAPGVEPGLFRFMSWFWFARATEGIVLGDGTRHLVAKESKP